MTKQKDPNYDVVREVLRELTARADLVLNFNQPRATEAQLREALADIIVAAKNMLSF